MSITEFVFTVMFALFLLPELQFEPLIANKRHVRGSYFPPVTVAAAVSLEGHKGAMAIANKYFNYISTQY
jgi:hypothetical protein